jgi:FkbH-like protein
MKGIITDLDGTLWAGSIGSGIKIDPIFTQYQLLLSKLSSEGVLIAVSTKNDIEPVSKALATMIVPSLCKNMFPIVANWGPKSAAITQILRAWNILAEDVVFIDNKQFELEEVQAIHPTIKTILFPTIEDWDGSLFKQLRDWFPKHQPTEDDLKRMDSIRQGVQFAQEAQHMDIEQFMSGLGAEVRIITEQNYDINRVLELLNKTNQFNVNGRRYSQEEWDRELYKSPFRTFAFAINYKDRFGDL